jgi:excisionase family DNA binding protein
MGSVMPELLTPQEVAKRLKIVVRTVYEYIQLKEFPNTLCIGGQYRIPEPDVAKFEQRNRVFTEVPDKDTEAPPRRRVISRGVQ